MLPHEPPWPDSKQNEALEKFVVGLVTSWDFLGQQKGGNGDCPRAVCVASVTLAQITLSLTSGKDLAAVRATLAPCCKHSSSNRAPVVYTPVRS